MENEVTCSEEMVEKKICSLVVEDLEHELKVGFYPLQEGNQKQ